MSITKRIRLVVLSLSDATRASANELVWTLTRQRCPPFSPVVGGGGSGADGVAKSSAFFQREGSVDTPGDGGGRLDPDVVEIVTVNAGVRGDQEACSDCEIEITTDLKHCDAVVLLLNPFEPNVKKVLTNCYNSFNASSKATCLYVVPTVSSQGCDYRRLPCEDILDAERDKWSKQIHRELRQLTKCKSTSSAIEERQNELTRSLTGQLRYAVSPAPIVIQDCDTNAMQVITSKLGVFLSSELGLRADFVSLRSADGHAVAHQRRRRRSGGGSSNSSMTNLAAALNDARDERAEPLSTRAPSLHWTSAPSPEELQLTFRFSFLCSPMPDVAFGRFIDNLSDRCSCSVQYSFRWTDGLLVHAGPVKIFVCRSRNDKDSLNPKNKVGVGWRLEVSVRVDTDELEATLANTTVDDDDDNVDDALRQSPTELLWSELAIPLTAVFDALDALPRLPYQIHLIPYGQRYYRQPLISEHPFNLVYFFTALEKDQNASYCAFRQKLNNGSMEDNWLNLNTLMSKRRPTSLEAFREDLSSEIDASSSFGEDDNPFSGGRSPKLSFQSRETIRTQAFSLRNAGRNQSDNELHDSEHHDKHMELRRYVSNTKALSPIMKRGLSLDHSIDTSCTNQGRVNISSDDNWNSTTEESFAEEFVGNIFGRLLRLDDSDEEDDNN